MEDLDSISENGIRMETRKVNASPKTLNVYRAINGLSGSHLVTHRSPVDPICTDTCPSTRRYSLQCYFENGATYF